MSQTHFLGFDIGGTNARSALIELQNGQFKILSSKKTSTRGQQTPKDIASVIASVTAQMLADYKLQSLDGIGVAIAGQIDIDEHTIINAPNLNWHHVNFFDHIKEALSGILPDVDIRIANDLNAIAWGEYHFGAAHSLNSLLAVYVGTGIGAGLIIDGKLMLGADNVSGEIGHCKSVRAQNMMCGCGQVGCVEAYAGGKAIEYRIQHDIQIGATSRQELDMAEDEAPTARCIERAYKTGVPYAVEFWKQTSAAIGELIANAIAILNPQGLLLGGGVLEGCPELLTLVVEHIMEMAPRASVAKLQFIKPTLHDDAGTLGAALLTLKA